MIINQKYMIIFIIHTSQTYTYDLGGNRTNYFGTELEWGYGRTLTHYDSGVYDISYQYNADGMLTKQTVNYSDLVDFEFNNYYDGDRLVYRVGSDFEAWYDYDETGSPIAMTLTTGGTTSYYYFIKNLQGDVIAIADTSGTIVRKYNYDAWGKLVSITDGNNVECVSVINTSDPAIANPFRYRSYFYDDYSEKYWLQTRFYDPVTGRFINGDGQFNAENVLGSNLYVYCLNNPVNMFDSDGQWPKWITGALNVVGGALQIAAGAALGVAAGWTGIGAAAAGFLIVNGAATVTQGIGQIVNDVTQSNVLPEYNIPKAATQELGRAIGGDTGATIAGAAYDTASVAASVYAGRFTLQQAGKIPVKVSVKQLLNNPTDEFVTLGPANGRISDYCRSIPYNGYGKIYATPLPNGFYQLADGHHRVAAIKSLGIKEINIFLSK